MSPLAALVLASVTLPVVMVAVGLVLAMAGLALLTGTRGPASARGPTRAPPTPDAIDATDAPEPCDWTAVLDRDDGQRTVLRPSSGRACCTYAVHVRDLDGVPAAVDTTREDLVWSGVDTRLGPGGAVTPLHWEVVTRRVLPAAGRATTSLRVSRAPAPPVRTSPWRPQTRADATPTSPVRDPAELWRRHLDDLRAARAHPAPVDGPSLTTLTHRRRVEIRVSVRRGCAVAPRTATVDGTCRVDLHGAADVAGARLEAAALGAWVVTDGVEVAGARLGGSMGTGPWSSADQVRTTVADPDAVTVVVGEEATLEVGLPRQAADGTTAELQAEATSSVHLRLAPTPATDTGGCRRCVPVLELRLGDAGAAPGTPDPTAAAAHLRVDDRAIPLRPPPPDSATRSWVGDVVDPSPDAPARALPQARW